VLVKLNNLPEEFPLSFVLDLLEISGEIDSDYKPLIRETADVLALEAGSEEIAKSYDKNEKFRLVVNQGVMKKILMFRGESLNVARIVRFEKKE
jgi:hypothetical protein